MMSPTQRREARFGFDKVAVAGGLHATYGIFSALEVRAGAHFAAFPRSIGDGTGGILAATLGPLLRRRAATSPYLGFGAGVGWTGKLVRPFFALDAGLDLRATDHWSLGPTLGYGQLVQWNGDRYTSDARYFWFGAAVTWHSDALAKVARTKQVKPRPAPRLPPKTALPLPPPEEPPPTPELDAELTALIEYAVPPSVKRVELLAPVLFSYDSAALTATAVAMLHEVASVLREHPGIELVEINSFADARGSDEHNLELSARRAETVRAWLVQHDIAPERLTIAPRGASEFVEPGTEESSHQQNRRVVFRILREASTR